MSDRKANESELNTLHQMIAKDLIRRIRDGEATVQELSAAIRFLKDNEVVADITTNVPLRQLEEEITMPSELPFIDEEPVDGIIDTEEEDEADT